MTLRRRLTFTVALVIVASLAAVRAADPSGTWTSTFATEIGEQLYTYTFVVKGSALTGSAKSNLMGDSQIVDGKIDGDKITFTEVGKYMDMELRIPYTGTMTSADEIQFTRVIADMFTEKLVAKRAKK